MCHHHPTIFTAVDLRLLDDEVMFTFLEVPLTLKLNNIPTMTNLSRDILITSNFKHLAVQQQKLMSVKLMHQWTPDSSYHGKYYAARVFSSCALKPLNLIRVLQ